HFQERPAAHAPRAQPGPQPHPERPRREPAAVLAPCKGAPQRKTANPFRTIERELLRNDSAHRMPDHMSRRPTHGIEQRTGILGHGFNGDWATAGQALTDATVVEEHRLEAALQPGHLRSPTSADDANALDEQDGRTMAREFVLKLNVISFK